MTACAPDRMRCMRDVAYDMVGQARGCPVGQQGAWFGSTCMQALLGELFTMKGKAHPFLMRSLWLLLGANGSPGRRFSGLCSGCRRDR